MFKDLAIRIFANFLFFDDNPKLEILIKNYRIDFILH